MIGEITITRHFAAAGDSVEDAVEMLLAMIASQTQATRPGEGLIEETLRVNERNVVSNRFTAEADVRYTLFGIEGGRG